MNEEQTANLKRGREIVNLIDQQLARAARTLELEMGQNMAPNVEEDARMKALLRSFKEWAKQARELGVDVEKEFATDLPNIKAAFISTQKPTITNPLIQRLLNGDFIEEGGPDPKPKSEPNPINYGVPWS